MPDERSGCVVFMSHCLLNQNTRYLVGAVCPGVVTEALDPYMTDGIGIVQMPCPEQRVWRGVLKRRLLWLIDHPRIARGAGTFSRLVNSYIRLRYRRTARTVIRDLEEYATSGFNVVAVIGLAGSPSCGVNTTSDLGLALTAIGTCPSSGPTTDWINRSVVAASSTPGQGLFIQALSEGGGRRSISVPFDEVDLASIVPKDANRGAAAES
jgi:predicted secreted protein